MGFLRVLRIFYSSGKKKGKKRQRVACRKKKQTKEIAFSRHIVYLCKEFQLFPLAFVYIYISEASSLVAWRVDEIESSADVATQS